MEEMLKTCWITFRIQVDIIKFMSPTVICNMQYKVENESPQPCRTVRTSFYKQHTLAFVGPLQYIHSLHSNGTHPFNKIFLFEWYWSKSSACQLNQTGAKQPLHIKKKKRSHLMNNRQVYEPWHMWCSDLIILTSLPLPRLWSNHRQSKDCGASSQMSYLCLLLGLCSVVTLSSLM